MQCDQYLCKYCFTSCAIRRKRTTFKPDELATTFVSLQREKRVDGLFLSSGIVPDANTTMEKMLASEDPTRALRLYQADFMLRDYGFRAAELPFDAGGLLPRDKTPKQAWAECHLHEPIEVNQAPRHVLLKVPGIGPKSADRIIAARREARLRDMTQLKALGVTISWAAPYVLLDGRRMPVQLGLW